LTTEVERTGIPSASFGAVLVGAALAWATLERTTAVLGAAGDTYETSTTNGALKIVPRPEVAQRNTALRLLRAYLAELGLTPAALGRVDRAALPKRPGTARSFLFPKALP